MISKPILSIINIYKNFMIDAKIIFIIVKVIRVYFLDKDIS